LPEYGIFIFTHWEEGKRVSEDDCPQLRFLRTKSGLSKWEEKSKAR
jgi:hypothetical protein